MIDDFLKALHIDYLATINEQELQIIYGPTVFHYKTLQWTSAKVWFQVFIEVLGSKVLNKNRLSLIQFRSHKEIVFFINYT